MILVVLGLLLLAGPGCNRESKAPEQWLVPARSITPTWGAPTEGLQCRIRPTKRLWEPEETILFKLDLRNGGKRVFAVSEPVRAERIAVDGRWYPWPQGMAGTSKVQPLKPGAELADLSLILPQAGHLPLNSGQHHIQVVLEFEGIEVVSGPVGIEIASSL